MKIQKLDDKHKYIVFDQNVMKEYITPDVIIRKLQLVLFQNFQKITKVADGDKILKINFSKLCHPRRRLWAKIESTISPDHVFKLDTYLRMDIDKIWALETMIQHEHHEIVAHLLSSPNMDVNYQVCEILNSWNW